MKVAVVIGLFIVSVLITGVAAFIYLVLTGWSNHG